MRSVISRSNGSRCNGPRSKGKSARALGHSSISVRVSVKLTCIASSFRQGATKRRAQLIRGRMALDGLYVPERAPWYANFRAELLSFPAGKHDDQVDALGLIGQLLNKMVIGRPAAKPEETQQVGYAAYESRDNLSADTWGL